MIEQINANVFRVNRSELRTNTGGVFEQIQDIVQCDASYLIARKRDDATINGSLALIDNIENDYRSHCFVIVQYPTSYPVIYKHHEFTVTIDRYDCIISISENEYHIELMTERKIWPEIVKEYAKIYGVRVESAYLKVYGLPN